MEPLKSYIPLVEDLTAYSKGRFQRDLVAGLTVGVMLVPQGMAYAYLAGMPPIYGLYAGLVPLLVYGLLGSSRHLAIGPVAVSALLVFAGLSQLAEPLSAEYVELAIFTGLLIGLTQMLMSVLRLGMLVNFISHPVISGFTSAAAVIVIISQLKDVFGLDIPRSENQIELLKHLLMNLSDFNWLTLLLSTVSLATLLVLKRWNSRIPAALLVVVLATLASWFFDFGQMGVKVVGDVPQGLPQLGLPKMSIELFTVLIPTVLTVTAISIVESLGIAKYYEGKSKGYRVQNNQELFALGLANFLGAFAKSMPTSGSFSRSAVNFSSRAKTGVSSLVSALIVALSLLFLTPLFKHLPMPVLAAIILRAVINLFDYKEAIRLWKVHKRDFVMLISTFGGTLLFGIEIGVLMGFVLSIVTVLYRSSKPNVAVLGKIKGTSYFRSMQRYPNLEAIPHTLIVRFDEQLYYGNAQYFKDRLYQLLKERENTRVFILDASNIHDIDSTGLSVLEDLHLLVLEANAEFRICNLVEQVEDVLLHAGLLKGAKKLGIPNYNSVQESLNP